MTLLKVLPFAIAMYCTFALSNKWFERSHPRFNQYANTFWEALSRNIEAGSLQWYTHAVKHIAPHHEEEED